LDKPSRNPGAESCKPLKRDGYLRFLGRRFDRDYMNMHRGLLQRTRDER
jgi:hypothetical protein